MTIQMDDIALQVNIPDLFLTSFGLVVLYVSEKASAIPAEKPLSSLLDAEGGAIRD